MQLIQAGDPRDERTEAFVRFLQELGNVTVLDVDELASARLDADVLVIAASHDHDLPVNLTLETLSIPTVLVATYGAKVGEELHLKLGTNYGCMCLGREAIARDPAHPVFAGLAGHLVERPVPDNFARQSHWLDVPEQVATLRVVADPGEPGQATTGLGFLDSPECEIIAGGFNDKTHEHFAVARQGRFLQWGFAGTPDQYTPEGRALFAACIRYIAGFADDPVRELRTTPHRRIMLSTLQHQAWRGIGLPPEMAAVLQQGLLDSLFAGDIPDAANGEQPQRLAWFREHAPWLYNDGTGWVVDEDARSLGFANDDLALLDAALKTDDDRGARVWQRYTGRPLDDVATECAWLDTHRPHLYFTDWGGYRWVSLLDPPNPVPPTGGNDRPTVTAAVGAARYGDDVRALVFLHIPPGFHAYGPAATDGLPISVSPADGFELVEDLRFEPPVDHLTGQAAARFTVRGDGDELAVGLRVQLCDSLSCLVPQTLDLRCAIQPAQELPA